MKQTNLHQSSDMTQVSALAEMPRLNRITSAFFFSYVSSWQLHHFVPGGRKVDDGLYPITDMNDSLVSSDWLEIL